MTAVESSTAWRPVCPPWCDELGRHAPHPSGVWCTHEARVCQVEGVTVTVSWLEGGPGDREQARDRCVHVEGAEEANLTAWHARTLAAALLQAAEMLEQWS